MKHDTFLYMCGRKDVHLGELIFEHGFESAGSEPLLCNPRFANRTFGKQDGEKLEKRVDAQVDIAFDSAQVFSDAKARQRG